MTHTVRSEADMYRSIALVARTALRFVALLMFFMALGAVTATVVLFMIAGDQVAWAPAVSGFALAFAAAFGLGAIGHGVVMPPAPAFTRQDSADKEGTLPAFVVLLVAILVGIAVLQVPRVVAWWARNLGLLEQLMGGERDPLGLSLVPAIVLVSTPAIAGLAIIAYTLGGAVVLAGPVQLVTRVLGACVFLQSGLMAGLFMLERALDDLGRAFQRLVDGASDPLASAQVAEWLTRYELNRGPVGWRLKWILGGYILAFVVSLSISRRREASADEAEEVDELDRELPDPVPAPAPARAVADTSPSEFNDTLYSVRPRPSLAGVFLGKPSAYDITTIPPRSSQRFALSWNGDSGALGREPGGEDLFRITASRSARWLGRRVYEVTDVSTAESIGTLTPIGADWEVRDAAGQTAAQVVRFDVGPARARYVAKSGEREIWRFVWGQTGVTGASTEMQLEFLEDDDRLNRALAVALAAIIEGQARRVSRWGTG